MGQSCGADHFTGAAHISFPLPISPFRGSEPDLELQYSSSAGNDVFGLGFGVGIDHIGLRTDVGIPRYDGGERYMSAAGELVPLLRHAGGAWQPETTTTRARDGRVFQIRRFRARPDTTFTRYELWQTDAVADAPAESFWRALTRDNHCLEFGTDADCREVNPADPEQVVTWLLRHSRDAHGNQTRYDYVSDPASAGARRHIARANYGRYLDTASVEQWHFQLVFDYSERALATLANGPYSPPAQMLQRADGFSRHAAGFRQRTSVLCGNVLMYHQFGNSPAFLTRALHFEYNISSSVTTLAALTTSGIRHDDPTPKIASLPPVRLSYTVAGPRADFVPLRLADGRPFIEPIDQIIDLHREGLPGLLLTNNGSFRYARPLGHGRFEQPRTLGSLPISVEIGAAAFRLVSLDGDGSLDLVDHHPNRCGFSRLTKCEIGAFTPFPSYPTTGRSGRLHDVDITGDGKSDLVEFTGQGVRIFPSKGSGGFAVEYLSDVALPPDFPVTQTPSPAVYTDFADLFGDGGAHLVQISAESIRIWPSLGWGKYLPAQDLSTGPRFGPNFDPARLGFVDADGLGPQDLIYNHGSHLTLHRNLSGNGFAPPEVLPLPSGFGASDQLRFADVLGTGTTSLIATMLGPDGQWRHWVQDLSGAVKPSLLCGVENGKGAEQRLTYASSTQAYLADRAAGVTGAMHPPSPVQVVSEIALSDHITGSVFTTALSYRQGYYDPVERSFNGFALVEMLDHIGTETAHEAELQPARLHREWFHTGQPLPAGHYSDQFRALDLDPSLCVFDPQGAHGVAGDSYFETDATMPETVELHRELCRSLRGHLLHSETYSAEGFVPGRSCPVAASGSAYSLRMLQPALAGNPAVCIPILREHVACNIDGTPDDARLEQFLVLQSDAFGQTQQSVLIHYPRAKPTLPSQGLGLASLEQHSYFEPQDSDDIFLASVALQSSGHPLPSLANSNPAAPWTVESLTAHLATQVLSSPQYLVRNLYMDSTGAATSDRAANLAPQALLIRTDAAVWPERITPLHLARRLTHDRLCEAGLYLQDGHWWRRGEARHYNLTPGRGAVVIATSDAFGETTTASYDAEGIFVTAITHIDGGKEAARYDLHCLLPDQHIDPNGTVSEIVLDPLGRVVATSLSRHQDGKRFGDGPLDDLPTCTTHGLAETLAQTEDLLGTASSRYVRDDSEWSKGQPPPWSLRINRRAYASEPAENADLPPAISISYHDGFGTVIQSRDIADPGPSFQRDGNGALIVDDKGQPRTQFADRRWRVSGWVQCNNKGLPIRQFDPFYSATSDFESDALLRELGSSSLHSYDAMNRLIRVDHPNGTFTEDRFLAWSHQHFDEVDTLHRSARFAARQDASLVSAEESAVLAHLSLEQGETPDSYDFGSGGLILRATVQPDKYDHVITDYGYDSYGQLVSLASENHPPAARYLYNMVGERVWTDQADAGAAWQFFDAMGATQLHWDSMGRQIAQIYDDCHHPIEVQITDPDGGTRLIERRTYGPATPEEAELNRIGRVIRIEDATGIRHFDRYDITGEIAEQRFAPRAQVTALFDLTIAVGVTEAYCISRRYDPLGRPVTVNLPMGVRLRYHYDREGHGTGLSVQIEDAEPLMVLRAAQYDALGQSEALHYGETLLRRMTHDSHSGNLIALTYETETGLALHAESYLHDPLDNPLLVVDRLSKRETSYRYDAMSRLLFAEETSPFGKVSDQYSYDLRSNIFEHLHIESSGTFLRRNHYGTENNQLLQTNAEGHSVSPTYDTHGNMTALDGLSFSWDDHDLLSLTRDADGVTTHSAHDGHGWRRLQEIRDADGRLTDRFIYLSDYRIHIAIDPKTGVQSQSHCVDLHDGQDWLASLDFAVQNGEAQQPRLSFVISDPRGSAVAYVDAQGNPLRQQGFSPFGQQRPPPDLTDTTPGFLGHDRDRVSGLINFGVRAYAPWLGRWISPDPSGTADGLNLYQYAQSNPIKLIDRVGHSGQKKRESARKKKQKAKLELEHMLTRTGGHLGRYYNSRRGGISVPMEDIGRGADFKRGIALRNGALGKAGRWAVRKLWPDTATLRAVNRLAMANEAHQRSLPASYHAYQKNIDSIGYGLLALNAASTALGFVTAGAVKAATSLTAALGDNKARGVIADMHADSAEKLRQRGGPQDRALALRHDAEQQQNNQFVQVPGASVVNYLSGRATPSSSAQHAQVIAHLGGGVDTRFSPNHQPIEDYEARMKILINHFQKNDTRKNNTRKNSTQKIRTRG